MPNPVDAGNAHGHVRHQEWSPAAVKRHTDRLINDRVRLRMLRRGPYLEEDSDGRWRVHCYTPYEHPKREAFTDFLKRRFRWRYRGDGLWVSPAIKAGHELAYLEQMRALHKRAFGWELPELEEVAGELLGIKRPFLLEYPPILKFEDVAGLVALIRRCERWLARETGFTDEWRALRESALRELAGRLE